MTIISHVPGRIRIRDARLTDTAEAHRITGLLQSLPGITHVSVNRRTAGLLVQYDPASGAEELLRDSVGLPESVAGAPVMAPKSEGKRRRPCPAAAGLPFSYRQFLNYGMMAACAASGIGIALHYRKLHAAAGFLFFGLSGLHMYDKRKTLFT